MVFGLLDTGFNKKDLEDIKTEIEDDLKDSIDPNLNVTATSALGQQIAIFAASVSELWDVAEALNSAFDPDEAVGESLDSIASISGSIREPATYSTVTATVTLTNGTTLPAGSKAYVTGNTTAIFSTDESFTNDTGITDDFDVAMTADGTGPTAALAGSLVNILTPVSGWSAITNAADAEVGQDIESDSVFRQRRQDELRAQGNATFEAIRAKILEIENVEEVVIIENDLSSPVGFLNAHSFNVVARGDFDEQEVAEKIFEVKPIGIETCSVTDNAYVVVDSQGFEHDIEYDLAIEDEAFVSLELLIDDDYPVDGNDQVKAALVSYFEENIGLGDDVVISKLFAPIYEVSGVVDVESIVLSGQGSLEEHILDDTTTLGDTAWDATGDFAFDTTAEYTHSSGSGTLTQLNATFLVPPVVGAWYFIWCEIGNSTGSTTMSLTSFSDDVVSIPTVNGISNTYAFCDSASADFVLNVTSTSGGFEIVELWARRVTAVAGNLVSGDQLGFFDLDSTHVGIIQS